MALVRKTVADVANPESTTPHSFVEALLSFITYIATHIAGGNMVVGAGLVPLLIQVIDNKLPIRLPMVSKAMQLIDNVLYNFANAFQVFCSARGVEVLVNRIEYEIDFDLESHGNRPGVQDVSGCGELPVARAAILKHTLRSLNRMMQSSGTAEGLRGLIDSSILKSIKKVIQYRGLFGPSVLPIAINIMSTFIHNEPTSLPTIQESGLPETFYRAIEGGLEASIEASVIQAIPNAIGALCLNEAGQKQLASRPSIIPTIFSIFVSERHLKVLLDKENAVLMGTAIDELIRHHPSLKGIIFDSLKSVMTKIEDMGNAWKPEGDFAKWYALTSKKEVEIEEVLMVDSELETLPTGDQDVTMDDGQENTPAAQAIVEEPLDDPKLESDEASKRPHDNQIVSFIDTINRFLEGLFQHPPHCKDFVSLVGLGALGRISSLPCLPYDFASSVASDSMVQVMRTLAEICTTETVQHLMMLVRSSLDETNDFWHVVGGTESKLFALVEFSENDSEERNRQFRRLIALHIRITLLSDVFATASYAHGRAAIALLQTLMSDQGPNILPDLGALHRAALCENLLFKTAINTNGIDVAPTPVSASFPGSPFHGVDALPTTDGMATANGVSPTPENVNIDEPSSGRISAKADESRQRNASSVKHISHGLPAALAPFFQALVKTFHSRRNPDPAQKQQISRASKLLADVLMQHISQSDIGNKVTTYSYYSLVFGLITSLLVDERQSSTSLHTVALVAFYDAGGFEAVSTICHELVASIAEISLTKVEDRSESQKQELLHAQGALKIALHLILPVISSKHLFESGQTLLITTPDKKDTDPGYFEPHNFLVKLRVSVVELLASLWEADWLLQAPLPITKSVVQTVLEIVNGENEESKHDPLAEGALPSRMGFSRPTGPDENRIRQLIDMGFQRSAAERALLRTHNNLSAATEFLLSHPNIPEPVPAEPEPEPEPEPAAEDAVLEDDPLSGTGTSDQPAEADAVVAEESTIKDTEPSTIKSAEEWRKDLDQARTTLRNGLNARALQIVDEHPQLISDLNVAFVRPQNDQQKEAVRSLVDDIASFSPSAYDLSEQPLANRCQLLAWVVWGNPTSLNAELRKTLLDRLLALLLSNPTSATSEQPALPKWLAAHLLCVEALITLAEEPRTITIPKQGDPIVTEELFEGPPLDEARNVVFEFSLRLLAMSSLPTNELISALRLLVLLTRRSETASLFIKRNGMDSLLSRLKTGVDQNCASYVLILLRHIIEDAAIIKHISQQSIKQYFSQARSPFSDVTAFLRHCNPMALRDPRIFIESTAELCSLNHPYATPLHISLKNNNASSPSAGSSGGEPGDSSGMQVDQPIIPAVPAVPRVNESAEAVVHALLAELMRVGRSATQTESNTSLDPAFGPAQSQDGTPSENKPEQLQYQCFLMQCLTELLFSYEPCKVAFLSFSPKKRTQSVAKDANKLRNSALNYLLSELISSSTLNAQPVEEDKRRASNWAMSVIVALCVDTSTSSFDSKEVSGELLSVRKFVLEAVSRAIKDSPSAETIEAHYGRLLSLSELCLRLLTVKFNVNPRRQSEETSTHIAKIMLEKNFVAALTNSLSEIDLNYPNVRSVVASILKPLEQLTKTAIKMSRTSSKPRDLSGGRIEADNESFTSDEGDDADDDGPREETPDLYRNSALGMYGGEMEDANYRGEDEDMDEDEEDEEDDVDMEFQDDTGSEDTSGTDEEEGAELGDDAHESGEAWGDEDEEDDLVENDEDEDNEDEDEDEGNDDHDGEDEDEDEDHIGTGDMWTNHAGPGVDDGGEDGDEDEGVTIPIIREQDDGQDALSDEGGYDELAIIHHGGGDYTHDIVQRP